MERGFFGPSSFWIPCSFSEMKSSQPWSYDLLCDSTKAVFYDFINLLQQYNDNWRLRGDNRRVMQVMTW